VVRDRDLALSAGQSADPQPVTVRVAKLELAPVRRLAVRTAELGLDRVDVAHIKADQGVGPGITPVLGQEQPGPATCDRHEGRAVGVEAMHPLLCEAQASIPGNRPGGRLGRAQRRDAPPRLRGPRRRARGGLHRPHGPDPAARGAMIRSAQGARKLSQGSDPRRTVSENDINVIRVTAGQNAFSPASEWRPQQDSNLRSRLRRPLLSPLSYGGCATPKGTSRKPCANTPWAARTGLKARSR
jgi:hypothetical protein